MSITVRPLQETFAAEVRGVDLRQPVPAGKMDDIYDAFLEHGVLVIPGQALSIEQQLDFASRFGELWQPPSWNDKSRLQNRQIDDVSNVGKNDEVLGANSEKVLFQLGNQLWHSDLSSNPVAAQASMLHALEVAPENGETEFADPRGAYDSLPEARKQALEGLIGEFSWAHGRMKVGYEGMDVATMKSRIPPSFHPVVRTHPETGRRNLFVGGNMERILGLPEEESVALIEELYALATQPRFVYRHRWAVHDLVIWDNRRTLHRALPYDADNVRRVMHRATVRDEGPTVVDGVIVPPRVGRRGPRMQAAA